MKLLDLARYVKSPDVALWRKGLVFAAVAYVLLPVDAIPDVVPLVGWLDDVGVLGLALAMLSRDVRRVAAGPVLEGEVVTGGARGPLDSARGG